MYNKQYPKPTCTEWSRSTMKKKLNNEYCTQIPKFPTKAVVAFLLLEEEDAKLGLVPSSLIYTSIDEAARSINDISVSLYDSRRVIVNEIALLANISIEKHIPLSREYWSNPSINYGIEEKIRAFTKIPYYPSFYKIIVTPTYLDSHGIWYFDPAFPYLKNNSEDIIKQFMLKTNHVVEMKAKYAALYDIDSIYSFDWQDRKISPVAAGAYVASDIVD